MRSEAAELSESPSPGAVADELRGLLFRMHGSTLRVDFIEGAKSSRSAS